MPYQTTSNRSALFTPAENALLLEGFNSYKDTLLGKCNNTKNFQSHKISTQRRLAELSCCGFFM